MSFDYGAADRLLLPLTLRPALAADSGAASVLTPVSPSVKFSMSKYV